MQFESPSSLQERWREIFREIGQTPQAVLALTYTFNADFVTEVIGRFAEAACDVGEDQSNSFNHVPMDVVCDQSQYRPHHVGSFNVTLWPDSRRLFHPKVFIVLFKDEVVWSDGSLNLTRQGWHRNREIAMMHRPGWKGLPSELRELLKFLDSVVAARVIHKATANISRAESPDEYVTSLHEPIGRRFLASVRTSPPEVHLVAPFFEKGEAAEEGMDGHWLQLLIKECRSAKFHIYLPMIEKDPLTVQGSRQIFTDAERHLAERIILHPVEKAPGPLHAKIACIVYVPDRIRRAHILVGSPNMTQSALMAAVGKRNIESAWIIDTRWEDAKRIFYELGTTGISIDKVEFEPPVIRRKNIWAPLKQAVYDPLKHELRIQWKDSADSRKTLIFYAGRPLSVKDDHICPYFKLVGDIACIETRKRGGGVSSGFFPIEIPVESMPFCGSDALERTPDDWLKMLGSVTFPVTESKELKLGKNKNRDADTNTSFKWSERVRDLASRMRFFIEEYSDTAVGAGVKKTLLKLFNQIYDTHDPGSIEGDHEKVWRIWVRLELWQAAIYLAKNAATRNDCTDWRNRGRLLKRNLGVSNLKPEIRAQIRAVVKAMMGAS